MRHKIQIDWQGATRDGARLVKYHQELRERAIAVSVCIKPLEDRVVIKQLEAETVTASGLVIPDMAKEKPQEGTVVAVGPGRVDDKGVRVPMDVKEGDKVIYSKYAGNEVEMDGETVIVLKYQDLLAKLN